MEKKVFYSSQLPLAKVSENSQVCSKLLVISSAINGKYQRNVKWCLALITLTLFNLQVMGQPIFAPLSEDYDSVTYQFDYEYNDQAIAQTGVRYGVLAPTSHYLLDQMMIVHDVYEKIPAAFRLVPNGANMPIWNFRYWPEEEVFTWSESRNYWVKPTVGYVCNRKFEVIDTFGISNPHEFYVMPNNLGYAYLGSLDSNGFSFPTLVWVSADHDTNLYWTALDSQWGIDPLIRNQSTCNFTTLDTFDNNTLDYYHPNSIAAIQTSPNNVKIGLYNRNTDTEFEISVNYNGHKWIANGVQELGKENHLGHQSDDSVWVNTAHDLQYLYTSGDTIVKSLWDNGGCRARPNTGYKVFTQHSNDSIRTFRKGLFEVLGQSTAMGNGGVILKNRYASSLEEIENAPSYGNIGSANFDLSNDNGMPKLGVWTKDNTLVYAIKQDYSFLTYRFYPYLDNQLPFDDLRPYMNFSFSADSSSVVLWLDSTDYTDILWIDGVTDTWSRTFTYQQFITQEMIAFVTNNPSWFWFSSHRYRSAQYVGVGTELELNNSFSVYPNPVQAGNALTISANTDVMVTNMAGKVITSCNSCNTLTIPSNTAAGMYLLTTSNGKAIARKKVVVY